MLHRSGGIIEPNWLWRDIPGIALCALIACAATWMALAGPLPTLVVAKIGACICGVILYAHGTHRALASLTILYFVAAVAPWLYLLSNS